MTKDDYKKLSKIDQDAIFKAFMRDCNKNRIEVNSPFQFDSWIRSKTERELITLSKIE